MRATVHSHVTQIGNQTGSKLRRVISDEHATNVDGNVESGKSALEVESERIGVSSDATVTETRSSKPVPKELEAETTVAAESEAQEKTASPDNVSRVGDGAKKNGGNERVTRRSSRNFSTEPSPVSPNGTSFASSCRTSPRPSPNAASAPKNIVRGNSSIDRPSATEPRRGSVNLRDEDLLISFGKTKKGYYCIFCGKMWLRKDVLKIHIRTHTGYKPFKCQYCSEPYADPSNLRKHVKQHRKASTTLSDEPSPDSLDRSSPASSSPDSPSSPSPVRPARKNVARRNSSAFERCVDEPSGFGSSRCTADLPDEESDSQNASYRLPSSATSTSADVGAQLETLITNFGLSKRRCFCIFCGKCFSDKKVFRIHTRTHTGHKPLKCKFCFDLFADPSNLRKHVKKVHLKVKTMPIPVSSNRLSPASARKTRSKTSPCNEASRSPKVSRRVSTPSISRTDFGVQLETIVNELPISKQGHYCIFCGKFWGRRDHLKAHMRIHTGHKPFKCKHCPSAFNVLVNFKRHLRIHERTKTL